MIERSLIFSCAVLMIGTVPIATAQSAFKPATFNGLTMGRSTVSDARKKLGEPENTFTDRREIDWLYYRDIGPAKGRIEMIADHKTGVIKEVSLSRSTLTFAGAQTLFGRGYRLAKYDIDHCLAETEEGGPLYESPKGYVEYVVYDAQGIALSLDGGRVNYVYFLSEPLGAKSSICEATKLNLVLSGRVLNYRGDYGRLRIQLDPERGGPLQEVAVNSAGHFRFNVSHKGLYFLNTRIMKAQGEVMGILSTRQIQIDRNTNIDIDLMKE